MDVRFLTTICEAYLIDNNVYTEYNKKDIELIQKKIIAEVIDMTRELRNTDLELYTKIYDTDRITQQQIIKTYLDYMFGDDETINESVILISAILSAIATMLFAGPVSKTVMGTASKIGQGFEHLGKFLISKGRDLKFRYAIVQKNAEKCYTRCKVDTSDVKPDRYLAVKRDSVFTSPKAKEQGQCLSECYILCAIDALGLLLQSYFMCLRKTGSFEDIGRATPDDLLKVISGLKLGAACNEYYIEVKNGFDNFYSLLDFVYGERDELKQEKIALLKNTLIQKRNEVTRSR